MAKFPSLLVVLTAVTAFSLFFTVISSEEKKPWEYNCQFVCTTGRCEFSCPLKQAIHRGPLDLYDFFYGPANPSDYRHGWRISISCAGYDLTVPTMPCGNGTYINLKRVFYGQFRDRWNICNQLKNKTLPEGGCGMKEAHFRAIYSRCHAKPYCSNDWKWPSEICPNLNIGKWNDIRYDCVPYNMLTLTKAPTQAAQCCDGGVIGGYDDKGNTLFVGRTYHNDCLLPCYIIHGQCVFAYAGEYGSSSTFEYLDSSNLISKDKYKWRRISSGPFENGKYPEALTVLGITNEAKELMVGRTEIGGGLYVGMMDPDDGVLIVGYRGGVFSTRNFELLML